MPTKYWRVGGTNTWSATANWSTVSPTGATGAAIPAAGDDVVISNVGQAAGTINIGATATAKLNSFTVIGGTWTVAGATQVNVAGTFDCRNVTWSNTGLLSLQGTGGSYDINTSGTTFNCAVTFNAFIVASSSFNLLSAFTTGATQTTTLTAGTLILNNFTLTTGIFNTNATNTREIQFGTGNIALIHTTAATTVLVLSNYSNFTCSGTGGFTSAMSTTRTFNVGSTGASNSITVNLALTSGASVPTFTASGWFNTLNFTGSTCTPATVTLNVNSLTLASGGTYTALTINAVGTGTITPAGKSLAAFTVNHTATTTLGGALSVGVTGTTTLTLGTLDLAGFTLTTGIFSSNQSNTRAIAFGAGNIVLSHTTASTVVLSMATATGFTWTGTGGFTVADMAVTRTFTFGTTGGTISNAPKLTFTTGASVATITTASWFNTLNFGTTSFNPGTTTLNLINLTLSSSGTYTLLSATMLDTGTIIPNGKTIAALIINHAGTTTLSAGLGCTTFALTAGTINFASFNLTCSSTATYTSGTLSNIGTLACTTFTINGPAFNFTSGTINPSTSFVLTSGSFTYNGGTLGAVPTFTHTAGTVTFNYNYSLAATGTYVFTADTLTLGANLTTGIFNSSNGNTRAIAFSTFNIVLTHTTAATTVLAIATATGFTWTGTGGFTVNDMSVARTFSFGNTAGGTLSNAPNLTFTTGASVGTIASASWFKLLDFGTTSFSAVQSPGPNLQSLTLSSSGTYTSFAVVMVGTGTITPNGKRISTFTINNSGYITTLAGALQTGPFNMTAGTIDFATYNLTAVSQNFTYTTGTISNVGTLSCSTAIIPVGVTFTWNSSGTLQTNTISVLGTFIYTAGAILQLGTGGVSIAQGSDSTVNLATITLNASLDLTVGSTTIICTYVHYNGTLNLNNNNLKVGYYANYTQSLTTRGGSAPVCEINFGTGLIQLGRTAAEPGGSNGPWTIEMATGYNFTNSGTGGFQVNTSVGRTIKMLHLGGMTAGVEPLLNIPFNVSFTGSTGAVTIQPNSYFKTLDFSASSCTFVAQGGNIVCQNLVLGSSASYANLPGLSGNIVMNGPGSITSNGKSLERITLNQAYDSTATTTLNDALILNSVFTIVSGRISSAYNITALQFVDSSSGTGQINSSNNIYFTLTGTATIFTGVAGFTISSGITIYLTAAVNKNFVGGGGTYPTLMNGGAGTITISDSNTFDTLTNNVAPSGFKFTAGTTQTVTNFTANGGGIGVNLFTLTSTTPGAQYSLSKASGTVSVQYLSIRDCVATGGADWYAGALSTDVGNNSGWIFTAPPAPSTSGGKFFLFF